jgi:hypothetical protein
MWTHITDESGALMATDKTPIPSLTDPRLEKKRKDPVCNATAEMKVYINSFFAGRITYREILFLILAERYSVTGAKVNPGLIEVQQEYAHLRAHLLTCGACLRRINGISPRLPLLD